MARRSRSATRASRSIRRGTSSARRRSGSSIAAKSGWHRATTSGSPIPTCTPFEPVRCHTFITEATFALPIYTWDPPASVIDEILTWWRANRDEERPSVVFCYVLGKAQRILAELAGEADGPIHLHGAMAALTDAYRESGIAMAPAERITEGMRGKALARSLVLGAAFGARHAVDAPAAERVRRFRVRSHARARRAAPARVRPRLRAVAITRTGRALLATIAETGASRVLVTHGWSEQLARYLAEERGLETGTLKTAFEGETGELSASVLEESKDDEGSKETSQI